MVSFGTDRSLILIYTRKDSFNKSCLTLRALNSEHSRFNGHWTLPFLRIVSIIDLRVTRSGSNVAEDAPPDTKIPYCITDCTLRRPCR